MSKAIVKQNVVRQPKSDHSLTIGIDLGIGGDINAFLMRRARLSKKVGYV